MLYVFIIFFFMVYTICEFFKYKRIKTSEGKEKVLNKPVVYIKLISIVITLCLIIINRFTMAGVLDKSNNFKSKLFYFTVLSLFLLISVVDILRIKKSSNDK